MKIVVDRGRCIAASRCLATAPYVFALDGQRKAFVEDSGGADDETIRRAAARCPTGAIALYDETTGEPIPAP
ncbi:MAG TPA: ferredoxin [Candidatus Polarisedimenticolia bacterium]|nr:ferredoxin [Candidatus Polarisedimenticolia bacterium]